MKVFVGEDTPKCPYCHHNCTSPDPLPGPGGEYMQTCDNEGLQECPGRIYGFKVRVNAILTYDSIGDPAVKGKGAKK